MNDYVKISYAGKEYVGTVKSVEGVIGIDSVFVWDGTNGTSYYDIDYYKVCIIEKDT